MCLCAPCVLSDRASADRACRSCVPIVRADRARVRGPPCGTYGLRRRLPCQCGLGPGTPPTRYRFAKVRDGFRVPRVSPSRSESLSGGARHSCAACRVQPCPSHHQNRMQTPSESLPDNLNRMCAELGTPELPAAFSEPAAARFSGNALPGFLGRRVFRVFRAS